MHNILKLRIHQGLALRLSALTPLNNLQNFIIYALAFFGLKHCGWFMPIYLRLSLLISFLIHTHFVRNTTRAQNTALVFYFKNIITAVNMTWIFFYFNVCTVHLVSYYPDQRLHNININNILYIVSTPTCFDTFASSSGCLILPLC